MLSRHLTHELCPGRGEQDPSIILDPPYSAGAEDLSPAGQALYLLWNKRINIVAFLHGPVYTFLIPIARGMLPVLKTLGLFNTILCF